jgi:aspartyl-tRNA(Asn)/glutamyl-tRNA(Gln) amidotransferase subunit C
MPSELSRDQVVAVAALANLELEPAEIDLFARQLADILAYADEVQNVDTTGVPPTTTVVIGHAADRADEVQPCLDRDEALAAAPDPALDAGFFRVPKVIG